MARNGKYKLLLVDDDSAILQYLADLLAGTGLSLYTAPNATRAMGIIGEQALDLALVDLRLPDMSGIDVLEAVQAAYPRSIRMLMSGYSDFESAARAVNRAGIHRILIKPIEPIYLRSALRQALEQIQVERERSQLQAKLLQVNQRLGAELKRRTRDAQRYRQDLIHTRQELERTFWELAQSSRFSSLGLMMGVLAHDLRNPLTVLSGQLQILSSQAREDAALAGRFATMTRQVDRIQELLEAVSRLAQNDSQPQRVFSPMQALKEALSLTRKLFSTKGIEVTCARPPENVKVRGNFGHWVHILYKLLEFVGQRVSECKIIASVERMDDRTRVLIRYPESGVAGQLQRVFALRRLPRLTANGKSRREAWPEATSFYLCARILEQYGGSLQVSESDGETIFMVSYPLVSETLTEPEELLGAAVG